MMKYYSGIGARKTSNKFLTYMENLGECLAKRNYILRSGGAPGADSAFERGCDRVNGQKEIYLPWHMFNNHPSTLCNLPMDEDAKRIAKKFHPKWEVLSHAVQKMHTRNTYQILGQDLKTPSRFVICWTDGTGGTMLAINIAKSYNIPVINLKLEKNLDEIDFEFFVEHLEQTVGR